MALTASICVENLSVAYIIRMKLWWVIYIISLCMMYQSRRELIPSLVERMLLWQLKEPRHWRELILNRWSRRNKNYAVGNAVMDTGSCYFLGKDPIACQHVKNNALLERITTPGCIPITFLKLFSVLCVCV